MPELPYRSRSACPNTYTVLLHSSQQLQMSDHECPQPFVFYSLDLLLIFMADIQALLSALDVFGRAPDKTSIERANSWLQDFQHSVNLSFAYGQSPRLNSSDRVNASPCLAWSMDHLQCSSAVGRCTTRRQVVCSSDFQSKGLVHFFLLFEC